MIFVKFLMFAQLKLKGFNKNYKKYQKNKKILKVVLQKFVKMV